MITNENDTKQKIFLKTFIRKLQCEYLTSHSHTNASTILKTIKNNKIAYEEEYVLMQSYDKLCDCCCCGDPLDTVINDANDVVVVDENINNKINDDRNKIENNNNKSTYKNPNTENNYDKNYVEDSKYNSSKSKSNDKDNEVYEEENIKALLTLLPESLGGLLPIAIGLFIHYFLLIDFFYFLVLLVFNAILLLN
jgi:hypothetical protein